jgi:cbb3-type cytochrome oxidase cytochrome c subunit
MKISYASGVSFVMVVFFSIIFITVVVPQLTFQPTAAPDLRPYTDLELRGRQIYLREGCWYCHTQNVRPQDVNLGPVSVAGDYYYDSPALIGSERTGPDLSNEGGKFPDEWHKAHIKNPRSTSPGSIMPSFSYLSDDDLTALVAYLQSLGRGRQPVSEPEVPWQYKEIYEKAAKEGRIPAFEPRFIVNGQGVFNQNCAACHGLQGRGNGPNARDMIVKPANFTEPRFLTYSDAKWFWRIMEGVPGTQMPVWKLALTEEQGWYLVQFLKFVAYGGQIDEKGVANPDLSTLKIPVTPTPAR